MITASENAAVNVLLVEDDPGDVLLTREALSSAKVLHRLDVVDNGEAAVDFFRRQGDYANAVRPDVCFLDLNLPRLDGRQVLSIVKADPDLRSIPIVVLTTSSTEEDILRSYDLHANAFVSKPVDLDAFMSVVRQIDDFFVTVARLPGR
jgi:CheY-like chemotaxis protein